MGAGHGGASGLKGRLADTTWEMSFFFDQLGLVDPEPGGAEASNEEPDA